MATLKFHDPVTGEWRTIWAATKGEKGDKGDKGDTGAPGASQNLDDLLDVTITSPAAGQVLGVSDGVFKNLEVSALADGRYLRLAGGTVNGGLTVLGQFYVNGGVAVRGAISGVVGPVTPDHAANKEYVDGRIWTGSQGQYDAIPTKDPNVLYVVV